MGGGVGKSKNQTSEPPFNVQSSVKQLEKKYDELIKAAAKNLIRDDDDDDDDDYTSSNDEPNIITTEYVIAARAVNYIDDWVPIAQLVLARCSNTVAIDINNQIVNAAVYRYRRELCHFAAIGSRIFTTVPCNIVEYSIEPTDSFYKYAYDAVISTSVTSNIRIWGKHKIQ